MELKLQNGDYVLDGAARLCRVEGAEALLQRVLFRLSARRGAFPFWGTLGSQLWQLGRLPAAARKEGSGSPRPGSTRRAARHCALPAPPRRKPPAPRPPRHTAASAPPPA